MKHWWNRRTGGEREAIGFGLIIVGVYIACLILESCGVRL